MRRQWRWRHLSADFGKEVKLIDGEHALFVEGEHHERSSWRLGILVIGSPQKLELARAVVDVECRQSSEGEAKVDFCAIVTRHLQWLVIEVDDQRIGDAALAVHALEPYGEIGLVLCLPLLCPPLPGQTRQ